MFECAVCRGEEVWIICVLDEWSWVPVIMWPEMPFDFGEGQNVRRALALAVCLVVFFYMLAENAMVCLSNVYGSCA